ncbi:hypothetical protein ACV1D8_05645 [Aeromonas caviae]|uniref:hypothetical protein n=1 Tax=Aeromonas caviae TaxID=648 RepID=UPI0019230B55|nr:hypothetical protein [Aeromonas caviae]
MAMNTVGEALVALFFLSQFIPLNHMVTAALFVNGKLMPFFGKSFPPSSGSIERSRMRCAGDITLDNKE